MSHVINRIVVDRDCSKDEVLSEIREEVFHEDWEEGGQYHENLNWHDGKVYANYEEAVAAIEKFDNGLYDDHAVLFHDLDDLEPTERENKAAEDVDKAYQDWIRVVKDGRANARSTKLVTCSHCSSKIAVSFLPDNRNRCPVCGRVD